jgi:hypothetical protein
MAYRNIFYVKMMYRVAPECVSCRCAQIDVPFLPEFLVLLVVQPITQLSLETNSDYMFHIHFTHSYPCCSFSCDLHRPSDIGKLAAQNPRSLIACKSPGRGVRAEKHKNRSYGKLLCSVARSTRK